MAFVFEDDPKSGLSAEPKGRYVFEPEEPKPGIIDRFTTSVKSDLSRAGRNISSLAPAAERVTGYLAPDLGAAWESIRTVPQETERLTEEVIRPAMRSALRPTFGRAAEIPEKLKIPEIAGALAASGRAAMSAPFNLVTPRVVNQTLEPPLQAVSETAGKVSELAGLPKPITNLVKEFSPDAVMIALPVAYHKVFNRAPRGRADYIVGAREEPAFVETLKQDLKAAGAKIPEKGRFVFEEPKPSQSPPIEPTEIRSPGRVTYDEAQGRYVVNETEPKAAPVEMKPAIGETLVATVPPESITPESVTTTVIQPPKPKAAPTADQNLAVFLTNSGGVSIARSPKEAGELRARRQSPAGKRMVNAKAGLTLDEAAQRAHEAGFIEEPSASALLAAMDSQIEGKPVFSTQGAMRERKLDLEAQRTLAEGDRVAMEDAAQAKAPSTAESPEAVTARAHQAATSPLNDLPQPTEAQIQAGNYTKGHVRWQGFDVSIENPKGSVRSGKTSSGEQWSVEMPAHYGYLRRSKGADGEAVDIYLGDRPSDRVFVVDQIDANTGKFDEHKAIGNVASLEEAQALYDAGFSDQRGPQRRGAITEMSIPEFKEWVEKGETKKPVAAASKPRTEVGSQERERQLQAAIVEGNMRLRTTRNAIGERLTGKEIAATRRAVEKAKAELRELEGSAPPTSEPSAPGEGGFVTSIKNAQVDKELAAMGKPPATHGERMSFEEARTSAAQIMATDPFAGQKLIDELVGKPRPATAVEDALLLHEQTRLKNERILAEDQLITAQKSGDPTAISEAKARVEAATADFATLADVVTQVGTESSLSLGHRRMMMKEDYSLAAMERAKQVSNEGKPLTDEQRAEVKALHEKIVVTEKAFEKYMAEAETRRAEMESEIAHNRLVIEAKEKPAIEIDPQIKSLAERIVSSMEVQADAARIRLRERLSTLHAGIDPRLIADASIVGAAKIARLGLDFTRWSKAMIEDLGDKIGPFLKDVWEASNKRLDDRIEKMAGRSSEPVKRVVKKSDVAEQREAIKDQIRVKVESNNGAGIFPQAQRLARLFVEQGIKGRDALIDAVHGELKEMIPGTTRRETMDAISGYGRYGQLSKDQISVELRDLKGQMQQVAKLEDIQSREPPLKTGVERRAPSDEERHLIQQVNEAKRRFGIVVTDPATQLQSALGARKTYYRNQISDLGAQITAKEKFVKERSVSPTDPELQGLKSRRDELKKEFDDIFEKPGLTDEQRVAAAIRGAEKSIADLEQRIETGDIGPRTVPSKTPSTPALEALRARRDVLTARLQEMRDIASPRKTAEQKALVAVERSITDIESRLKAGDISSRNRPSRTLSTPELEAARARRDALREQLQELRDAAAPKKTPEQIALQALKTRLKNQTANLTERLARGDFSKKPRRELILDPEANSLQFANAKVKAQWHEALIKDRLAHRTVPKKIIGGVGEVFNTSRAVLTSMDLSAVLRQGAVIGLGHPVRAARAFPSMFKALVSEKGQYAVNQEILSRQNYRLYKQSNLYLAEHGQTLSMMEEAYMSRWADKIPLVAASQRAYTTFLNRLRADSFDAMANTLGRGDKITPGEANAISNFINVATGRGSLGMKENAMVGLNTVFFAPRYVASRFQLIAGQPFYRGTGRTRVLITKEYGRFLTGLGMVYALARLADGEIEIDPRSSDFGKIRFGNTRVDPLAGLSQTTVLLSRLATGETKTLRGRVIPIRGERVPYGTGNAGDIMARFLRSKLSPAIGMGVNILSGKNVVGEPVTPESAAGNLLIPLAMRDIYETMIDQGVPRGTALSILAIFGMGLQTFDASRRQRPDRRGFMERWGLTGTED